MPSRREGGCRQRSKPATRGAPSPKSSVSVLDMVNLLPPSKTDDHGESEAATTLRRGRFDVGVGDIAEVAAAGWRSQASFC